MRFAIHDHGAKSVWLKQQMVAAGHQVADSIEDTDLLLLDCDWPWSGRSELIDAAIAVGAKVALYPHGGMPTVFSYDGLAEPDPRVSLRLEHGRGSIEMAARFGAYELKQEAPGWLFSPTEKFKPVKKPRSVFFAPMHPNIEAMLTGSDTNDPAPALNHAVYQELLATGLDVTVSLVGPPHRNGVWHHPRVEFVDNPQMLFTDSFSVMAGHDVVIAAGTLGAAAVALGKPTVMFGQGDWSDYVDGEYRQAAHADAYSEFARYPLDCTDGKLSSLMMRACKGDTAAAAWRKRFVGDDGTAAAIRLLEELVEVDTPPNRHVAVQGVTALARGG